jgi:Flp pilus assembly protein TadD
MRRGGCLALTLLVATRDFGFRMSDFGCGCLALTLLVATVLRGQDAAGLYREGLRLLSEHQPKAAAEALERAVQARPSDAATWAALGVARAAMGDYAAAEEPFHRACLLNPMLPDACLYFGRTLYLLDRFEPALDVLRLAGEKDTQNCQIHRIAALCLEALGRLREAEASFRKAMSLPGASAPDDDPAIDYGVFLFRQGRAEDALAPLRSAVQRHPTAARAQMELGVVLLALDRVSDAAVHLEKAVSLDGRSSRAHLLLGKAYMRLGRDDLARRELDQGSRTTR